jgi:hypothetical protein
MSITTEHYTTETVNKMADLADIGKLPHTAKVLRSLAAERDRYCEILGNVLAVLNGDGGHRQADVGTEQATKDGLARFFDACARAEAAEAAKGVTDE